MKSKPYIHLFRCSTGYYLYDVNTDCILKVSEETFQILERRKGENDQIRKLISAGYLKENHVEISEHPMTPYLESFYKKHLSARANLLVCDCNRFFIPDKFLERVNYMNKPKKSTKIKSINITIGILAQIYFLVPWLNSGTERYGCYGRFWRNNCLKLPI